LDCITYIYMYTVLDRLLFIVFLTGYLLNISMLMVDIDTLQHLAKSIATMIAKWF